MTVREVFDAHNRWVDSLLDGFKSEMLAMVSSAQAHVLAELQKRLTFTNGVVDRTPANLRVLRQIGSFITEAMSRAGYDLLVDEYVASFNGHLPFFEQMLEAISGRLKEPLTPKFTQSDTALFQSQQLSAQTGLEVLVESAGASAAKRAMLNVGGLSFGELAGQIAKTYTRTVSESVTLAETSTTMFYRTISDRGFQQIEKDLPKGAIRYRFEGPSDRLTRPFCRKLLTQTKRKPMTRAQIDALDNGQLPNVFVTGGGYSCRHQWVIEEIRAL